MSEEKDLLKEVKKASPVEKTPSREELDRLELEAKQLEVELKKAELLDARDRLAERQMKRETIMQRSITNGMTLAQLKRNDNIAQERCNHKKGGNGAMGVVGGQGDDSTYAVLKHIMCNGDMWIRCLRCGKTWRPPYEEDYTTKEGFAGALAEYKAAKEFSTRNVTSSSNRYQWSDGGALYRKLMKPSTLR